jgi:hypothetical protein
MTSINLETIAQNVPSMCIPRTFINITRVHVYKTINDLNLGIIDHIDMVRRKNEKGEDFQRIFIHFSKWHSNSVAERARNLLLSGKEIKIIYDDPWFWKISMNRSMDRTPQERRVLMAPQPYQPITPIAITPPQYSSPPRRTYAQMASSKPPPAAPRKNNPQPEYDDRGRTYMDNWPRSPSTSPPPHPVA